MSGQLDRRRFLQAATAGAATAALGPSAVSLAADPAHAAAVRAMHGRLREVLAADGDPTRDQLPTDPLD